MRKYNAVLKEQCITLQSDYENYIGEIIRGRRMELGLNAVDVYSGICGEGVYNKIEGDWLNRNEVYDETQD